MVELFSKEEKTGARRTKLKLLVFWFILLGLYIGLVLTLMLINLYQVNVNHDRSSRVWMTAVSILATVIFITFSMFFFSIKFRLTRKYVRMLKEMERGLKDSSYVKFISYDETLTMKDGVYFYAMIVDAKPLKREDITERKVLIEATIPKPELSEGQQLKIITHANILISYKLLD